MLGVVQAWPIFTMAMQLIAWYKEHNHDALVRYSRDDMEIKYHSCLVLQSPPSRLPLPRPFQPELNPLVQPPPGRPTFCAGLPADLPWKAVPYALDCADAGGRANHLLTICGVCM